MEYQAAQSIQDQARAQPAQPRAAVKDLWAADADAKEAQVQYIHLTLQASEQEDSQAPGAAPALERVVKQLLNVAVKLPLKIRI